MAGGCQDSEEKTASDSEGGRRWLWGRAGGRGASAGAGPGVAAAWMRTALQPNAFDLNPVLILKDRFSHFSPLPSEVF